MSWKSVYASRLFRNAATFFLFCVMLFTTIATTRAEENPGYTELTTGSIATLPERSAAFAPRLTDAYYNSRISFQSGETLDLSLAEGARGLYVAWYAAPQAATLEMLDDAGKTISTLTASTDLLNEFFAIPQNCTRVRIYGDQEFAISELRVFDTETPPEELSIMDAQQPQPKVMVILSYPSDESYYFSSLLPYLSGKDAALVFLSGENRQAQQEAIEARYALGSRTQPIFGSFPCYPSAIDLKRLYSYIDKADVTNWLIAQFRRYQPDTLITYAAAAEDGIGMHELASTHTLIAADQAANEAKEYISQRAYGVWQVRAVYQHLVTGESPLYDTNAPLDAFGGESALSLAQKAYECYSALRVTHASVIDTPYFIQTYPLEEYAQQQSADELYALLASLGSPAAVPQAAATPMPSESPAPSATPVPDDQPQPESVTPVTAPQSPAYLRYLGAGIALLGLACFVIGLIGIFRKREGKKRGAAVAAVVLGLIMMLCGAGLLYREWKTQPSAPNPTSTLAPTATPPAATETPTASEPEAQEAGEAEETSAFDSHFRKADDPAEVVVFDESNGIYEYRNDTLAVEIHRVEQTEDKPLVYYIAHIYMRQIDSYRSGFGSVRINGRDTEDACVMARRYRAVLGMTGDNLLHSDYNRGMMMRDGRIFRAMTQVSLMALTDDFSMRIYNAKDEAMLTEIEAGTQDTFAFGPPLILGGVLCEDVDQDRVGRINPRAGLGLVEPGHFVAIVVDGRLPHYSHGMLLSNFAKLFQQEGCVMAYNLDGGASATMVFMGEYINKRAENHYRSVPDQLLWGYSELVPTLDDPYQLQGLVPQDWRKGE